MSKSDTPKPRAARLSWFERFARTATRLTGSSYAFAIAGFTVIAWAVSGPFFGFSETWQLVINTGTTIATFLMVFLIQHSQNKDSVAIHLKLNELLASHERASNRVVAIEDLSDEELEVLHKFYARLAKLAEKEPGLKSSHSLDEAEESHEKKHSRRR
jgi:low affinity Fe/Cu permease